jgi:uncharacterized protein DUF1290
VWRLVHRRCDDLPLGHRGALCSLHGISLLGGWARPAFRPRFRRAWFPATTRRPALSTDHAASADLNQTCDARLFRSGVVANAVLAIGLTCLGDRPGGDLFLAAVVAFGVRRFTNPTIIRRHVLAAM